MTLSECVEHMADLVMKDANIIRLAYSREHIVGYICDRIAECGSIEAFYVHYWGSAPVPHPPMP